MVNELHAKLLKYTAIIGLLPYVIRSNGQRKQQQRKQLKHLLAFEHNIHYNYHYQQYRQHRRHHQQQQQQEYQYIPNHYNKPLRWQQIYTGALIVANIIIALYGVIFVPFKDSLIISDLVSIIVFLMQALTISSILMETLFTYEKYYKLLNNYQRVETLMKQLLQTQLCKSKIRQRLWLKYSIYLFTLYVSLVVTGVTISIKYYYGFFWHAFLAIIFVRARSVQMTLYLDYIVYYQELLNIKLNALISCKLFGNYCVLDINYKHFESFEYLENLKYIYQEIYDLCKSYNDLYGQSLASIFTVVVLDIVINIYWTFLTIFEYYELYTMYITISTIVPLSVILFMLCYTGEQCEKQCIMTLTSLKRLLNTSAAGIKIEDCYSYNALLHSFIMQIIQNPLTISANSYFTVNLKTLAKILTNIVTYLVILLQFRKTSNGDEDLLITTPFNNDTVKYL